MNQLEINLKAAKMLRLKCIQHNGIIVFYMTSDGQKKFNLFTNPVNTLAVVKHLGKNHCVFMRHGKLGWVGWAPIYGMVGVSNPDYEEAVGAAVEAI